jgi:hypothetical protein
VGRPAGFIAFRIDIRGCTSESYLLIKVMLHAEEGKLTHNVRKINLCLIKLITKETTMKKSFITALAMVIACSSNACDICGCGVGNFNPHMFPHLAQKFISVGYNYRYYQSNAHDDVGNEMLNKEYYNSFSVAGQFTIARKIQLMGYLPFQSNVQKGPGGTKSLNKPGDAIFLANYRLIDHISSNNRLRQTFVAGAGVKLPTGSYQYEEGSEKDVDNPNFQAGTGSTDFLLNGSYSLRYKKFAMSTGITYKMNTSNKEEYRFGNRLLTVVQFKYVKDAGTVSVIPNIGVIVETMNEDRLSGVSVDHTGGHNVQATVGLDVNNRKIAAGIFYNKPVNQNLAMGHIQAMPGINIHVGFIL